MALKHFPKTTTHFRIPPCIRETWHCSPTRGLDMQRELLFETHADQVKMILVALKIIKNADVEQAATQ